MKGGINMNIEKMLVEMNQNLTQKMDNMNNNLTRLTKEIKNNKAELMDIMIKIEDKLDESIKEQKSMKKQMYDL